MPRSTVGSPRPWPDIGGPASHPTSCSRSKPTGTSRTPFVILETPAALKIESDQVSGLGDLVGTADRGTRIGLEARAYAGKALPRGLHRTMEETGILDVVDLSQTGPRLAGDTQYTRLFGPGPRNVYQFDDEEMRAIDRAGGD